ncbi:MAG: CopG family transcriptional regulator, partial [Thermoproteota archaeon]
QVTFTEEQWRLLEGLKGLLGNEDAEIVRNIVLAWLAEKSMISTFLKQDLKERSINVNEDIKEG